MQRTTIVATTIGMVLGLVTGAALAAQAISPSAVTTAATASVSPLYFCSATGKAMIRTTATGTCPRGYRKYVTAAKPGPAGPRGATGPAGAVGTLASTLSTSVDVGSSSFHNVAQVAVTSGHQYVAQWSVETVVGSPTTIYCDLENYLQGTSTFVTLPHGPRQLSVQSGDEAMSGSWSGTTPNTGTVYLVCMSPAATASVTSATLVLTPLG